MKVELIDKMGTDLSVVNAARVSYAKEKEEFEESDDKNFELLQEVEDIKKKKEIYQNTI